MSHLYRNMFKQSFKLAWPISLQNMLVMFLGMIDVIMVSHLGDAAVAAVGLGNRVAFVVQIIIMGLAWAVGVLAAQYFGAGKTSKIRSTILMASVIATVALIPIIIANYFFAADILALGTLDTDVIQLGEEYLWITVPTLIVIALIMIIENALRSVNHVRIPMVFSTIAIALNVVLNYWLIHGGLGVDAMGVAGAAWATVIARIFHLLLLVTVLIKIKHILRPRRVDFASLTKHKQAWFKIIKLGWPMMVGFGVWSLGTLVYQLIYGQMGTKELAVLSLLSPLESMFLSFFFGFASACAIMVGQHLGSNNFEMAWKTVRVFSILSPVSAIILGATLLLAQPLVFSLFDQLPTDTMNLASDVFMVIALGAWLKVISMTLAMGALRAGGDNTAVMGIDIVGMWVFSIPLTYFVAFHLHWPLFYVVITAYTEEIFKSVLFIWRVNSKKWLRNLAKQSKHKHA